MPRERMPAFARTGNTNLFGKLDPKRINDFKLPTEVLDRAITRANEFGMPLQEYLREVVCIGVMGREEVERRVRARIDAMTGKPRE